MAENNSSLRFKLSNSIVISNKNHSLHFPGNESIVVVPPSVSFELSVNQLINILADQKTEDIVTFDKMIVNWGESK